MLVLVNDNFSCGFIKMPWKRRNIA